MSDYFTNLVIRSFSPVASVQPMGVSLATAPELFAGLPAELSDPFSEAADPGEEDGAEREGATLQTKHSRDKPALLEGHSDEVSIRSDQASYAATFVNTRSNTITSRRSSLPNPAESAGLREHSNPLLSSDSPANQEKQPPKRASLESPSANASLTSSEKLSEPTAPTRKASGTDKALVKSSLQPSPRERVEELSSAPPGLLTPDESQPETNISRLPRGSVKPNRTTYLHGEPMDAEVSTWHLIKRPRQAGPLSPKTSLTPLTQSVSAAVNKLQTPDVKGSVVQPTTAGQETSISLTTLVPKVSQQPFLPVNGKTLPSRQAPYETTAPLSLSETIINVAIGRIEVRATPSESSKRERQSNGPKVMNLDDYTQQRSRGKR
jgi:hypothetical protein